MRSEAQHREVFSFPEAGKREELSTEELLREVGIEEGREISVAQIKELIERNPFLVEGVRRNFLGALEHAIQADFADNTPGAMSPFTRIGLRDGILVVLPFIEEHRGRPPIWMRKGDEPQELTSREKVLKAPKDTFACEVFFAVSPGGEKSPMWGVQGMEDEYLAISFVVSADRKTARNFYDWPSKPALPEDFHVEGVYVYDNPGRGQKRKIPLTEAAKKDQANARMGKIDIESLKKMINELRPIPDADCSSAFTALEKLATAEKIDAKEIEKMKKAIIAFATFVKPEPKTREGFFGEIGRCLVVPMNFNAFLRDRFGMRLDRDHYGSSLGSYHEVSTWGNIFVDWTARQFGHLDDEPYPYIYHRDSSKHGGGKLWSSLTKKEQGEVTHYERLAERGIEY